MWRFLLSRIDGFDLGDSADTFIGGAGASTMTGGGGKNLYEFNSATPGDGAVISNFVQGQDALRLRGYDLNSVLANDITQSGGSTFISLGNGTTIELKGFTAALHTTDFK